MVFVQSFVEIGPAVKEEIRSIETYIHTLDCFEWDVKFEWHHQSIKINKVDSFKFNMFFKLTFVQLANTTLPSFLFFSLAQTHAKFVVKQKA